MTERQVLPPRRGSITYQITAPGSSVKFEATVSWFQNGALAELFLNTSGKAGSAADVTMSDAAVAVSLALQHGCPPHVLAAAMKRDPQGGPLGPIGEALDVALRMRPQVIQ